MAVLLLHHSMTSHCALHAWTVEEVIKEVVGVIVGL